MLGWLTGPSRPEASDDSKVEDPPETPAPVFAIRAFKTALFGTPVFEDDDERATAPTTSRSNSGRSRISGELADQHDQRPRDLAKDRLISLEAKQPIQSPTKSILMTPGTNVRRKTVSFGEGLIEKERKTTRPSQSSSGLPQNYPGKFPSPWSVKRSDSQSGAKNKLTQSLLNVRDAEGPEKLSEGNIPGVLEEKEQVKSSQPLASASEKLSGNEVEETVNMNEPVSKSGQYWKSEYEQFESKTNREMKKLLQYRHIAKSFAKKKDEEATRLTEKLQREEARVARMEKQVTEMASNMAGAKFQGDGEQLVKELAKQTAMTLQYKQKVDKLREGMEAHNVLGYGSQQVSDDLEVARRLQDTEKDLMVAQGRITELTHENSEMRKLQVLAQATESKASNLAKENELLKASLTRVKDEMSKYDDRRKAKEERFKERETKLEERNQEYRARIERMTQERQESDNEKAQLLARIDELQNSQDRHQDSPPAPEIPFKSPRRRRNSDIPVRQLNSAKRIRSDDLPIDMWTGDHDLPAEDSSMGGAQIWRPGATEPTSSLNALYDENWLLHGSVSPPPLPLARQSRNASTSGTRRATLSPQPSIVNISTPPKAPTHHPQPRRANPSSRIDHVGTAPIRANVGGGSRQGLPPDRAASAKARLERKKEQKRLKEQGKENLAGGSD